MTIEYTTSTLTSPTLRRKWREATANVTIGDNSDPDRPIDELLAIEDKITPEADPGLWLEVFIRQGSVADLGELGLDWSKARGALRLLTQGQPDPVALQRC